MFSFDSFQDTCSYLDVWLDAIIELGGSVDNIEDELWELARESKTLPHFGNIYMSVIASNLENLINNKYPDVEVGYEINAIASWFSVDGSNLGNLEQITALEDEDEDEE